MANAKIYRKTIDPSVQDGIDQSLILDPNAFYQKKFDFGDDWTEVFVGLLFSFTASTTLDNEPFLEGESVNSGGSTNDTWNYVGLIRNNDTKYLPNFASPSLSSNQSFIGIRNDWINSPHPSYSSSGYNSFNTGGANKDVITFGGFNEYTSGSSIGGEALYVPFMQAGDTTLFASYLGLKFKVLNKGTSTQQIRVTQYSDNTGGFNNIDSVSFTDISLNNLKLLINSESYITDGVYTLDFNNGSSATNIPDSFFWYNAFITARPRIHAIAVKKIS